MTASHIIRQWGPQLARGETCEERQFSALGRITSAYQEGHRLVFWMLNDGASEIQVVLTPQRLGQEVFESLRTTEAGQNGSAMGTLSRTRRGVLTILATMASAEAPVLYRPSDAETVTL